MNRFARHFLRLIKTRPTDRSNHHLTISAGRLPLLVVVILSQTFISIPILHISIILILIARLVSLGLCLESGICQIVVQILSWNWVNFSLALLSSPR